MRLERRYEAEAAHQLSAGLPDGHPCRRLHGHRYIITVTLLGDVEPGTSMLMEYGDIDKRVAEVLNFVDHRFINQLGRDARLNGALLEIPPIVGARIVEEELAAKVRENSTVENLANWFIAELKHRFQRENLRVGVSSFLSPQVYSVRIEEDSRSAVEV